MPEPGCSLPGPIGPNLPSPRDPPPEPGFIPRSPAGLFPPPSPPREPVTPPGLPSPIRAVHPPPRPGPAVPSAPPVPSPHRAALPLPRSQPPPRSRPAAARTELPPPSCPPGRLPPPGPRCRCSRGGGRGGRWDPAVLPALHAHTCTRSGGCPGGTHVHTRVHTHTHTHGCTPAPPVQRITCSGGIPGRGVCRWRGQSSTANSTECTQGMSLWGASHASPSPSAPLGPQDGIRLQSRSTEIPGTGLLIPFSHCHRLHTLCFSLT